MVNVTSFDPIRFRILELKRRDTFSSSEMGKSVKLSKSRSVLTRFLVITHHVRGHVRPSIHPSVGQSRVFLHEIEPEADKGVSHWQGG